MNIHIYPSNLANESRIEKLSRSIEKLQLFSEIHVVGSDAVKSTVIVKRSECISHVCVGPGNVAAGLFGKIRCFLTWYINVYNLYSKKSVSCINAHSLSSLPLAVVLKYRLKATLIYDTHELETETAGSHGWRKKFAKITEQLLLSRIDHIFVVSDSIADHYAQSYGIDKPTTVLNSPNARPLRRTDKLRQSLNVPIDMKIFLYQGLVGTGRGLELALKAFERRADTQVGLVVMGYGPMSDEIKRLASVNSNIFFHPAVPPNDVLDYTSSADFGLALIQNVCLSYDFSMPNKLFEYGMAGLPCLVSDVQDIARYITSNQCGVVVTELDDNNLNKSIDLIISKDYELMSNNAHRSAIANSWEVQENILTDVYRSHFANGS